MKTKTQNSYKFEWRDETLIVGTGKKVSDQTFGQGIQVSDVDVDSSDVFLQICDAKVATSDRQRREVAQKLLPERRAVDGQIFRRIRFALIFGLTES